ncbi:MAG: urease accessory protein UreD [Actinomycetota bacterium]|nr:urease accessory protein UreD [Actinomycetota bacterium]
MRLARDGERTALVRRFASQPWGAVQVARPDASGAPEVVLTNPGGGTLGGDRLELTVEVGPGARATVCTQGATKVYRGAEAVQRTRLGVGDGGVLEHVPHHVIPYARSRWRQETVVDLAPDARLLAWEAFAAGRLARGERFAFAGLASRTLVLRDGAPVAVDGCELRGGGERFGGWAYLATVFVVAPEGLGGLADALHALLATRGPEVLASASTPQDGVLCARVLTATAPALTGVLNALRAWVRPVLGLGAAAREAV